MLGKEAWFTGGCIAIQALPQEHKFSVFSENSLQLISQVTVSWAF